MLYFEDGQRRRDQREHQALCAMVASGKVDPRKAFPEFFAPDDMGEAFPSPDADMSGFTWEKPTPDSVARDIEAMMHGARVTVLDHDVMAPPSEPPRIASAPPPREDEAALRPGARRRPPASDLSELEWG